jgi:hypothetical protein
MLFRLFSVTAIASFLVACDKPSSAVAEAKRLGWEDTRSAGPHASPPSHDIAKLKPGFRDLKWGDALPAEMIRVKGVDDGPVLFYGRPGDPLTIGDAQLAVLLYGFFEGRFTSVKIVSTPDQANALRSALMASWGIGDSRESSRLMRDPILWRNGETRAVYYIAVENDFPQVRIFNARLQEEAERFHGESASKGL